MIARLLRAHRHATAELKACEAFDAYRVERIKLAEMLAEVGEAGRLVEWQQARTSRAHANFLSAYAELERF